MRSGSGLSALIVLIALSACAASDPDPGPQLRADYPNLAVTRLGDFEFRYQYAQDTAILRSLAVLEAGGVARKAIKEVAIQSERGAGLAASRFNQQPPNAYSLWYVVEGCARNVFFRAGVTGQLIEMIDPAGCTEE